MSVNERLQKILIDLEDSISYKDWAMVESAKDELTFLIDDIDGGDFIDDHYDDDDGDMMNIIMMIDDDDDD